MCKSIVFFHKNSGFINFIYNNCLCKDFDCIFSDDELLSLYASELTQSTPSLLEQSWWLKRKVTDSLGSLRWPECLVSCLQTVLAKVCILPHYLLCKLSWERGLFRFEIFLRRCYCFFNPVPILPSAFSSQSEKIHTYFSPLRSFTLFFTAQ